MKIQTLAAIPLLLFLLVAAAPRAHLARAATTISFWVRDSDAGFVQPLESVS